MFNRHHKLIKILTSGFIVCAILFISYGPSPHTKKVEAQNSVRVEGGLGTVPQTITANASVATQGFTGIIAGVQASLQQKELTLDGIAFSLINIAIQQLTRGIVEWINSGFEGSPAFVTDFEGFLLDVADQEAGNFLTELGLGSMCSPFKLDVQAALAIQYQQARNYDLTNQCRLSEVVDNVDNFFASNDLTEGGWESWFSLTTQPGNNPYGALLLGEYELSARLSNARGEKIELLDWGQGFLSLEECTFNGEDEECSITTPGAVIESQLNNNLDSSRQRLVMADEINEIIGALFAQLVQQTFSGAGGLLGLSRSGYSSNGFSYVEAASSPSNQNYGLSDSSQNPIRNAISTENEYLGLQSEIVDLVDSAASYELSQWGTDQCSGRSLPSSLINAQNSALSEISQTQSVLSTLYSLDAEYNATNDPNVHQNILNTYLNLQSSGYLHTQVDIEITRIQEIGNQYYGMVATVNEYESAVSADCQQYFENQNTGGGGGSNTADDGTP